MVRVDGQVMSNTRYREYLQEQAVKPTFVKRVAHSINRYFFGRPEVRLSECIWFYGVMGFVGLLTMMLAVIGFLGS